MTRVYTEQGLFKKYWAWFTSPREVSDVAIANFFSYEKLDIPGFHREDLLTNIIDLSQSIEALWSNTRSGFVRKQIEQGRRRGVSLRNGGDFPAFYALYTDFCRRMGRSWRVPLRSLEEQGVLFTAYYEDKLIAGGVYIGDGVYLRAWVLASRRPESEGRMRDIIGSANRAVVWEAVVWAKQNGYRYFDLGGIAPSDPDSHIRNIASFKEAFGGERRMSYHYYKVYSPVLRLWLFVRDRLFL